MKEKNGKKNGGKNVEKLWIFFCKALITKVQAANQIHIEFGAASLELRAWSCELGAASLELRTIYSSLELQTDFTLSLELRAWSYVPCSRSEYGAANLELQANFMLVLGAANCMNCVVEDIM